jgi:hypothetical protein
MPGGSRTTTLSASPITWSWWLASTVKPPLSAVMRMRNGTGMTPVSTTMRVQAPLAEARSMFTGEKCVDCATYMLPLRVAVPSWTHMPLVLS